MNADRAPAERWIMGVDPGTSVMGYAILRSAGRSARPSLVISGVVDMRRLDDPYLKLQHVFRRALQVIDEYHPDELAIESQFIGKNIQSTLKLGRAQGVAIAAALQRDIPVFEYAPRKVKMSVTGTGTASKEQVATMLGKLVELPDTLSTLDETDAIAIAYCHLLQAGVPAAGEGKCKSWAEFVKRNPGKTV